MAQKHRYHTPYRDPQSEEARIACYCEECGKAIYEGDSYYQFGIGIMCESCVDECRTTAEIPEDEQ